MARKVAAGIREEMNGKSGASHRSPGRQRYGPRRLSIIFKPGIEVANVVHYQLSLIYAKECAGMQNFPKT